MRIVLMKIRRTKGRFLLFFFAVFFSMVMWLLTCLLYAQSANSRQYIEASTTTLALQDSGLVMEEIPGGGAYYRMEEPDAEKISQARASAAVKNNHRSTTFSGIGQGLTIAMPTEMSDRSHTTGRYFIAENTAAFTVKIESIVDVSPFGTPKYVDGTWIQAERAYYQILADVLEVHAFSGHPVPENITLMGDWVNEDGSIPFKPGESWVVIGTYQPAAPGWSSMSGKLEYVEPKPYANCLQLMLDGYPLDTTFSQTEEGKWVAQRHQQEDYPLFAPVGDERLSDMLALAQMNSRLLWVTGIDTVDAVPLFAQGDASIVQGRSFTDAESSADAAVCLISEQFAAENGLSLGSQVSLSLYPNSFYLYTSSTPSVHMSQLYPMPESVGEKEYTVVGIYRSVMWRESIYCFSPNTVFVPEASLPAGGYEGIWYASSLILHNGSTEAFLNDVEAAGLERKLYQVRDHGYTAYMASLNAMQADTLAALTVSTLLYLLGICSATALMCAHLRKDTGMMWRIGASARQARRYLLGCLLPVLLLAALLAGTVCSAAFPALLQGISGWYTSSTPLFSDLTDTSGVLAGLLPARACFLAAAAVWLSSSLVALCFVYLPEIGGIHARASIHVASSAS